MNWYYNENKFQYELYDSEISSNCLCTISESGLGTIRSKELMEYVNLFFEKDNSQLEKRVEKLEKILINDEKEIDNRFEILRINNNDFSDKLLEFEKELHKINGVINDLK